ncbi:MAG: HEAT repeat domain-containing protein, partial [Gemmataceae bacterium]
QVPCLPHLQTPIMKRFATFLLLALLIGCNRDPELSEFDAATKKLKEGDVQQRLAALQTLSKLTGDQAVPALVQALNDPSDEVGAQDVQALRKIGAKALPELVKAMSAKDATSTLKARGAETMIGISPLSDDALGVLLKGIEDPDVYVRVQSAIALGKSDTHAPKAVPVLAAALKDDSDVVRLLAINALGAMGPVAQPAIPALQGVLNDSDPDIRDAASTALKSIGGT